MEEKAKVKPSQKRRHHDNNVVVKQLTWKGPDPETMAFLQMLSEKQIELYKIPDEYLEVVKAAMCKRGDKPKIDWLALNREMHDGSY